MPKNHVRKDIVYKHIFMEVLKQTGHSIRELGKVGQDKIKASDKTIRRQLNEGKMRPDYIKEIAEYINVDSRVLTGTMIIRDGYINTYPLAHLDEYPFSREEVESLRRERIKEFLSRVLALFNRSYSQFEKMNFEEQYSFQKELLEAILPVVRKHFKSDVLGNENYNEDDRIIVELENSLEDHYLYMSADTTLRQQFLDNPPEGYTKKQIEELTPEELIGLDLYLQYKEELEDANTTIRDKYLSNPPGGYTKEQISKMTAEQILDLNNPLKQKYKEITAKPL